MPVLKFQNFTAASRKRNMIAFRMFRADAIADLAVIEDAADSVVGFSGTQNGTNTSFTLSAPVAALYRNGLRQATPGDYSVSGSTLTWVLAPQSDDIILGFAI